MTLVTLAGSSLACSSLAYRMVPVSFSISSADGAATSTARAPTVKINTAPSRAMSFFMVVPPRIIDKLYEGGKTFMQSGWISARYPGGTWIWVMPEKPKTG